MAGRKKKSAGRMPLWLYVLIVVVIALVTYFRTSGEQEAGDPQPPAASAAAQQTPADETLTVRFLGVGQGDSILLACGDETMLIDGGPVEEGQFIVSRLNRLDVPGLMALVAEHDPNSFPSGHTCAAFAAALSWRGRLPWKWAGRTAVALAVCMGLSRLYVGVHYPSDVITGGLIGAACAWATLRTTDWLCAWAAQRKNRKGAQ